MKLLLQPSKVLCLLAVALMSTSAAVAQDLNELMREGQGHVQNEDWALAADAFREATELDPDAGSAWMMLGYALHSSGKLDEAIKIHLKAAKFPGQNRQLGYYNAGCAYSLKKDSDKAFKYLNLAAEAGFDQINHMDGDSDLDNVRKDARFEKLIAKIKNGGKDPFDAKVLVGNWDVNKGTRAGAVVGKDRLGSVITFTKDTITIPAGEDAFKMKYSVDASKKPIEIDMEITGGPAPPGAKALGILKLDGDKFKLCYNAAPDGDRPDSFSSTEENGFFTFAMSRKKKSSKVSAKKMVGQWRCVKGVRAGAEVTEERLDAVITFSEDSITIPAGAENFEMSFTLNTDASPVEIDMEITAGPAPPGSKALGIVKMVDGVFYLCYNADPSGSRPTKFESTDENGNFYFEMEPEDD